MEMTRRWLVFAVMQIVNACLIASLSYKQLVPPDSKSFALVSIALAGLGIAIGLFKSPLTAVTPAASVPQNVTIAPTVQK